MTMFSVKEQSVRPITRHQSSVGSGHVEVVWCPHCDYSFQYPSSLSCPSCGAEVIHESGVSGGEMGESIQEQEPSQVSSDSTVETSDSSIDSVTAPDLYCIVHGRQFQTAGGYSSHVRHHVTEDTDSSSTDSTGDAEPV